MVAATGARSGIPDRGSDDHNHSILTTNIFKT
jgi:hypothetical protein